MKRLPAGLAVTLAAVLVAAGCDKKEDAATTAGDEQGATDGVNAGDQPGGTTGGTTGGLPDEGTTGGTTGGDEEAHLPPAQVTASYTMLDFGTAPINWGSGSIQVTFTNAPGKATATDLAGSGLAAPFDYVTTHVFPGFNPSDGCGATLAGGQSCRVNVAFAPETSGDHTEDFVFSYKSKGATQAIIIALHGRGAVPGSLDEGWADQGVDAIADAHDYHMAQALALDGQLRLVAAGTRMNGSDSEMVVRRYDYSGTPEAAFAGSGAFVSDGDGCHFVDVRGVKEVDGGKYLVAFQCIEAGFQIKQGLLRLLADGTLDPSYGSSGIFKADGGHPTAQLDGALLNADGSGYLVAADVPNVMILKVTAAGALDPSYATNGVAWVNAGTASNPHGFARDSLDNVYVGGDWFVSSDVYDAVVVKIKADGSGRDTSWGSSGRFIVDLGGANDRIESMTMSESNQLFAAARSGNKAKVLMVNLNTAALYSTYGTAGVATIDPGIANDAHYIPNQIDVSTGRAIVSGYVGPQNSSFQKAVVSRVESDGEVDEAFGGLGTLTLDVGFDETAAYSLAVGYLGNFYVGGTSQSGSPSTWAVWSVWQ